MFQTKYISSFGGPSSLSRVLNICFFVSLCVILLILVLFFPVKHNIPAVIIGALSFILVYLFIPDFRFDYNNIITPLNISIIFFLLQLILMPIIIMLFGGYLYVLPYFPSDNAINFTLLLNSIALMFFGVGYHLRPKRIKNKVNQSNSLDKSWHSPGLPLALILFGLWLLSIYLTFGSISKLVNYYLTPYSRFDVLRSLEGTWAGVFIGFFKFSMGYSVAILWAHWADKKRNSSNAVKPKIALSLAIIAIFIFNLSFNRGSMLLPLVTLLGVYSYRVWRISLRVYMIFGIIMVVWALIWGSYRHTTLSGPDLLHDRSAQTTIYEETDILGLAQLYLGGPQFPAFLIESTGYGAQLLWGSSIVASIMHPVPQLGKYFRPFSGVALYNRLIYGYQRSDDQVIPVLGELFINFNIPGIIVGFFLIGIVIGFFNEAFLSLTKRPLIYSYIILFFGLWTTVGLLSLSFAVTTQMYIYVFTPGYLILLYLRNRNAKGYGYISSSNIPKNNTIKITGHK